MIDPNVHSCGTVEPHGFVELQHPEQDFFIAGMKSYGRAPTFLLATGYEQVRSITAWLAGDLEAARNGRARASRDRRVQHRHQPRRTAAAPAESQSSTIDFDLWIPARRRCGSSQTRRGPGS